MADGTYNFPISAHTICARGGEKHMGILQNWEQWTSFLGKQVSDAKESGMPTKMIEKAAVQIGEYLAKNVDPQNEQERVLSDLWSVAEKDEKQAIASCIMKLVQNKPTH